jgi:hypothetical protein
MDGYFFVSSFLVSIITTKAAKATISVNASEVLNGYHLLSAVSLTAPKLS